MLDTFIPPDMVVAPGTAVSVEYVQLWMLVVDGAAGAEERSKISESESERMSE